MGLPGKRAADTDENRNKKSGKGTKYSPANRRPVARDLIILEAGGASRMDRRLHGLYTNVLIGHGVLIARSGYQPLLLCERWALRVMHWIPPPAVLPNCSRKRHSWFDRSEAGAQQS